jgi:hypothetical protein
MADQMADKMAGRRRQNSQPRRPRYSAGRLFVEGGEGPTAIPNDQCPAANTKFSPKLIQNVSVVPPYFGISRQIRFFLGRALREFQVPSSKFKVGGDRASWAWRWAVVRFVPLISAYFAYFRLFSLGGSAVVKSTMAGGSGLAHSKTLARSSRTLGNARRWSAGSAWLAFARRTPPRHRMAASERRTWKPTRFFALWNGSGQGC